MHKLRVILQQKVNCLLAYNILNNILAHADVLFVQIFAFALPCPETRYFCNLISVTIIFKNNFCSRAEKKCYAVD